MIDNGQYGFARSTEIAIGTATAASRRGDAGIVTQQDHKSRAEITYERHERSRLVLAGFRLVAGGPWVPRAGPAGPNGEQLVTCPIRALKVGLL